MRPQYVSEVRQVYKIFSDKTPQGFLYTRVTYQLKITFNNITHTSPNKEEVRSSIFALVNFIISIDLSRQLDSGIASEQLNFPG